MDREEKLRAAKEKLKKFQKKKYDHNSEELSSTRSTPKQEHDESSTLPLFTFDSGSKVADTIDFLSLTEGNQQDTTTVSDQIEHVLANSMVNVITDDVVKENEDHKEVEYLKLRLGQMENERSEMVQTALQHKKQIQSLQSDHKEAEAQVAKLQGQLNSEREEMRTKEATEAEKNKSTLLSHMDTIQILISEKAELEANVKKYCNEIAKITGYYAFV